MLNHVTVSIMFSTASPDPFKSVRYAKNEPALICEKNRGPAMDLLILIFYGKYHLGSRVPDCEPTLMKLFSDCLVRNIPISVLLKVIS